MNSTTDKFTPIVRESSRALSPSLARRLPSRQDTFHVLGACVIPVFLWSLLSFLNEVPGFALRLSLWDVIGMASYILAAALVESVLLLLPLLVISALLPARFFRNHFLAFGSAIAVITSLWIMYANYHTLDFSTWGVSEWLIGLALYLGSIAIALALMLRWKHVEEIVGSVVQRVSTLSTVYIAIGLMGILIVLIRNI